MARHAARITLKNIRRLFIHALPVSLTASEPVGSLADGEVSSSLLSGVLNDRRCPSCRL